MIKWNSKNSSLFQKALKTTLVAGQVFSLMPVYGITSADVNNVRFVKTSWKCFYSSVSLIGQFFIATLCLYKFVQSATLDIASQTIFYTTTSVSMANFILVARLWPALVQQIARTEEMDVKHSTSVTFKCNLTCALILSFALLEHLLSILYGISGAMTCLPNRPLHEAFVTHIYPWTFSVMPYSSALGILVQLLHIQSTFVWNFSDLFVINISYYLASRLEQVNKKVLDAHRKYVSKTFWRTTREDYCRATQLVRKVDDVINTVVFISFANNLFYVCVQLFKTLEDGVKGALPCSNQEKRTGPFGGQVATAYFLCSLIFLLSRSVAVSLAASQVNVNTLTPAPVLYDVPTPVYCIEVQRFLDQINGQKVALSGLKFFKVTRGLLLSVAGTIITYELVMVQLNPSSMSTFVNNTIVTLNNTKHQ